MATVSTTYIKDILKTLPIGYYLGSRAEIIFSETAPTSMCNPITSQIIVSAKNVTEALKNLPDDRDTEEFVRDALYHEVSHLILTPKVPSYQITTPLNIFEDERIECLLSKFYKKVNFKRFCLEMNHWTPDREIKDEIQFFFNIVRFRHGPQQFVDRVPKLIEKWHELNCMTAEYDTASEWFKKMYGSNDGLFSRNSFGHYSYVRDVYDFFNEVKEYWYAMSNEQKNQAGKSSSNSQKNSQQGQNMPGTGRNDEEKDVSDQPQNTPGENDNEDNGENGEQEVVDGKNVNDDEMEEGDGLVKADNDPTDKSNEDESKSDSQTGRDDESEGDGNPETTEENDELEDGFSSENAEGGADQTDPFDQAVEEIEKKAEENAIDSDILDSFVKEVVNKALTAYTDPAICANVRRIMIRACKKRANRAAVVNKYAGRIDPRSVGIRRDYRWFQQKGDNGSNKFDRIHLTLWVDKSGSFYMAMPKINNMIKSLNDVEKTMPYDFCFDVVAMDTQNVLHDKTQPMRASGGNFFGPGVEELSRKLNKPGWSNYNVVVWDGDLGSNRRKQDWQCSAVGAYLKKHRRAFNVFNNQHTIIVSDISNKKYLERPCRNARMKLINHDYASEFIGTVIELLDHML